MKRKCPHCGSTNIRSIVYGYPSPELWEEEIKGKVKLGGCCISENQPNYYCDDCEKSFNKGFIDLLFVTKIEVFINNFGSVPEMFILEKINDKYLITVNHYIKGLIKEVKESDFTDDDYTDTDVVDSTDEETDSEYATESDTEEYTDSDIIVDTDDSDSTESDIYYDTESDTDSATDSDFDFETDTDSETDDTDSDFYAQGDINADGKINTLDVLMIQSYLASFDTFDDGEYLRADFNASGNVDLADAIAILQMIAGYRV